MQTTTMAAWIRAELDRHGWGVEEGARNCGIGLRLFQKYRSGEVEPGEANIEKMLRGFGYRVPWGDPPDDSPTRRYASLPEWEEFLGASALVLTGA